jgi:putative transposase
VIRAHRIELIPTPVQETYFRKASGTARFTYNWGLARWNDLHAAGETPNV